MKTQSILGSAALGVGLGTLLLPAAALADTTVSPATTPVGGTVVLTSTCNPKSGDAIFHVTGPDRDQNIRSTTAAAGGGLSAELFTAGFTLGTYTVTVTCGDGTSSGSATFTVTPIGGAPAGTGTDTDNNGLLAAGGTLVGAAATGALLLVRRRRHAADHA
ncbi:LPXTG cell wall anchor domain-containing protein [Micromonospora rubida]|uniref:LPXTG cell wall anchor domain-containing protein n=1 Tax=Micromonospora rubida TaxID=2697657 RepID=A0ABW7STT1_9ACTN